MIIQSLTITEGKKTKTYKFSPHANLVHSDDNTVGKTTLLRLMLYALGYQIRIPRIWKFEKCITQVVLTSNGKTFHIKRENEYLLVDDETSTEYYILPTELNQFHAVVFGTDNNDVLKQSSWNFLHGSRKGWTLLNRGKVIGSISFSIEKLILGLSERDYQKLQSELQLLEREVKK